jgi:alkyldihydroxyacetonephosphate synthase
VITAAWMRLQDRPRFRAGGAIRFPDFFAAARAVRAISQSGLHPANCRILDPQEAANTGAGDGSAAIMVLGFESADHELGTWHARALECAADHGGVPEGAGEADAHLKGAAGCGVTPSSACPMPASASCPAPSSTTRSKPRSPGTNSNTSMTA